MKRLKTYSQILEYLLGHKGLTFNIRNGLPARHRSGYYVSLPNGITLEITRMSVDTIHDFIIDRLFEIGKPHHYLGMWIHNDVVYVDVSRWVRSYDKALSYARANNQKAFYDVTKGQVIYT